MLTLQFDEKLAAELRTTLNSSGDFLKTS